jgi:glycosyltransferase involved in cell wall biosynthesis
MVEPVHDLIFFTWINIMRFSLIMPTLNRKDEIVIFIGSLLSQTYTDFELIIIDQNKDNRVYDLFFHYKNLIDIKYIRSDRKGLSLNRNTGLSACTGDIISFPDDDCEYDSRTLENILLFFNHNPKYAFYTCNTKDRNSQNAILKSITKSGDISKFNIMCTGISFTIFVRTDAIKQFRFDEQLGVGAEYGSGEESDLLLYLLKTNKKGFYNVNTYIYHPYKVDDVTRAFPYGKGFGAFYKKAVTFYKYYILFPVFIFLLLKQAFMICLHPSGKGRIASIKGRLYGFIHYKDKQR